METGIKILPSCGKSGGCQKFNKILMIQIAFFATIPVKATRARPRAEVPCDSLSAQKFNADRDQSPRAL